jgi:hypothetical protein
MPGMCSTTELLPYLLKKFLELFVVMEIELGTLSQTSSPKSFLILKRFAFYLGDRLVMTVFYINSTN